MKLIIKCYSNNELKYENDFNHPSFYEVPFVQLGLKFNIIETPEGYHANNLAGLRLRRNFKANDEQKKIIIESSKLTSEEKYLLNIAKNKNFLLEGNKNICDLVSNFSGLKIGNLEDINSWFEEINIKSIDKIEFCEIED